MNYQIEYCETKNGTIGNEEKWFTKDEKFENLYFKNSLSSFLMGNGFNFNGFLGVWYKDNLFARAFYPDTGKRLSYIGDKSEKIY